MGWLLKLFVIWFSIDIIVIATGWYAGTVIRHFFTEWWRENVVVEMGVWKDNRLV